MKWRWRVNAALAAICALLSGWYGTRDHVSIVATRAGRLVAADTLSRAVLRGPGDAIVDAASASADSVAEEVFELELRGEGGLAFRARLERPFGTMRPLPGLLLLGGMNTGRKAVSLVEVPRPAVRMAIDYPYRGSRRMSPGKFVLHVPELREALYDAAAAALLAVDYLTTVEDIHADSLFIVGTSFGAFFAPIATAARGDVDALVLVQGGGDLRRLLAANLRWASVHGRGPRGMREFVPMIAATGALLLHPFEPNRWVGRVAPRPLYMVNGTDDERIPDASVTSLFEAAQPPKRLVWIDAVHVDPADAARIDRLTRAVSSLVFGDSDPDTRGDAL